MKNQVFNLKVHSEYTFYHKSWNDFLEHFRDNGVHEIADSDNPYHILIDGLERCDDYILVGFSGAVSNRENSQPPYFSFRNVAVKANVGLIAFSDPSLNLSNQLNLAWYAGNYINGNIAQQISDILDEIVFKTGKKLILAGGSGGGFAALNIHSKMRLFQMAKSFVWNPQTDITKYIDFFVRKYHKIAFNKEVAYSVADIEKYFLQHSIPFLVTKNPFLEQLVFINGYDPGHIRKHIRGMINTLNNKDKNRIFMGDWGNGHIQPPNDVIISVISSLAKGEELDRIISTMESPQKQCLSLSLHADVLKNKLKARVTLIQNENLMIVRSNLFELFMGYNIRYKIISHNEVVFDSDYLLGESLVEKFIKVEIKHLQSFLESTLSLYLEDIYGVSESFEFKIQEILDRQSVVSSQLFF